MKNFFKKLSFVLAIAMVLTTVVPATASAAGKNYMELNGKKVTTVTAWIGGVTRNLDYNVGGKTSGVKGSWKVGNTSVATINAYGVVTPVANGTTKVRFTPADGSGAVTITLKVRTRAAALHVYDPTEYEAGTKNKLEGTTVELNAGDSKTLKVTMPISKKAVAANGVAATYFLYATSSDESVVTATAGANNRSVVLKGLAAGEATVTLLANQTTLANVKSNKYYQEASFTVKVSGEGAGIASAEATKVNVVTVKFNGAAAEELTLALTKGTNPVENTVAWNADRTEATLTTTAKMTNGTYTVTATLGEKKSSADFEVVSQYVKEIKILNDVALTGTKGTLEAGEAYIYYKVLDQYGEDLTASTSVQWSTSTGVDPTVKRSEGKLTVVRSDAKAFTYGEQIYVTGVYTKTGVSANATLTVGAAQALNSIEMVGFVRKNTTKVLSSLPNGFKSGEYYLVFDALDQNGNALVADAKYANGTETTFITDNVLVVYSVEGFDKTIVIDGHEYNAIKVTPGQYVDKGGDVNITAIATKTGNKVSKLFTVGQNQILTSFTMDAPTGIIADGESIEIPFTALDQNGEAITSFDTLARNINKLTFTTSVGTTKLSENADGTAKLTFSDAAMAWTDSRATDGIDRPVSITSVVVGGNSDNLMLYISDMARPDAIKSEAMNTVYVEGDKAEYGYDSYGNLTFLFLDQYGREMKDWLGNNTDNGFFAATLAGGVPGTDFSGYRYDVVLEYKGESAAVNEFTNGTSYLVGLGSYTVNTATFGTTTQTVFPDNAFSLTIARAKTTGTGANPADVTKYEATSTALKKAVSVVDITQLKSFAVKDVKKLNVTSPASGVQTLAEKFGTSVSTAELETVAVTAGTAVNNGVKVTVTGVYNGVTVTVPKAYYKVVGQKVTTGTSDFGDNELDVVASGILYKELYDVRTANYVRKDLEDVIKVTISEAYSNATVNVSGASVISGAPLGVASQAAVTRDTVSKTVKISDATPVIATINADDKQFSPTNTKLNGVNMLYGFLGIEWVNENFMGICTFYDQYDGKLVDAAANGSTPFAHTNSITVTFKVSDIVEAAGYADNNFSVSGNDTTGMTIEGAELGDTFNLTITAAMTAAPSAKLSKTIKVTVGADSSANITNSTNNYVDTLIGTATGTGLEAQRQATLK